MTITTFPFDSVHAALSWFFNKEWIRNSRPKEPRTMEPIKYNYTPKREDAEIVMKAALAVSRGLERFCTNREFCVLRQHYIKKGPTQAEVAICYDLTDRGVRYIRERVMERLEDNFVKLGIVRTPKPGEPKYAKDEGEFDRNMG